MFKEEIRQLASRTKDGVLLYPKAQRLLWVSVPWGWALVSMVDAE